MGGLSLWHWLLVAGVGALLFGGTGKISGMMGDFAKGIKAFKAGMKDDEVASDGQALPLSPHTTPVTGQSESVHHSG